MKEQVYAVRTRYIFEGVYEVKATSREQARAVVQECCGLVLGGDIHSVLSDEYISWEFDTHPEVKICRVGKVRR